MKSFYVFKINFKLKTSTKIILCTSKNVMLRLVYLRAHLKIATFRDNDNFKIDILS